MVDIFLTGKLFVLIAKGLSQNEKGNDVRYIMKREEIVNQVLKEIISVLQQIDPQERLWVIDKLPNYFCDKCGDNIEDCKHDNN